MPWTATNAAAPIIAAQLDGWPYKSTIIHGLDPVTRRPYTYTIPEAQEGNMSTDLAIRFTQKDDQIIATLISADADGLAISVEKADPQTAASELVKAYFTLNPFSVKPLKLQPGWARQEAFTEIDVQKLLQTAADQGGKVEINYRDVEGARSTRHIEPSSIDSSRRLVFAWDRGKAGHRAFRLDRIERAQAL